MATAGTSECSCAARTALAGNPSDGHGGAVVAMPVRTLGARVTVRPGDRFEIVPSPTSDDTFDSLEHLVDHVDRAGYGDGRRLVLAAIRTLVRHLDADIHPHRVDVGSTIPRSVGLAGSSAIVIATMRSLAASHRDAPWARELDSDPDLLASIALAAEADELGIAAGLQDRVVQAYRTPILMDFAPAARRRIRGLDAGSYRPLGPPPAPVFVAARPATASASDIVHGDLAARRDDPFIVQTMTQLAEQAHRAARAIDEGDVAEIGAAMDTTFDLRASMMELDPAHVDMIEIARAVGAHANYSGSGGAIAVMAADEATAAATRRALVDRSCSIFDV